MPLGQKSCSHSGAYRVPLFNLSVCVSVTFVLVTDCDSCTRPISTNPVSMEACEHGLTRGTCCFARRLEVVAVAGRLWISWCVLGGADICCFFFRFISSYFFERTRPAASMRLPLASFTSLLVMRQGRRSEATEYVFCL